MWILQQIVTYNFDYWDFLIDSGLFHPVYSIQVSIGWLQQVSVTSSRHCLSFG